MSKIEPPKSSSADIVHVVTKAGLSAIPIVGGPAVELFQHVVQPPLVKRQQEWMAAIGEKLHELENRGVKIEDFRDNAAFISAVMHASQMAIRTHQTEKREALRNAVFNIALNQSPGEALEHMFFDWIDTLTPLHLEILKLFQAPSPPPNISMGGLSNVLEYNMLQLRGQQLIYTQIWKDLFSKGLVNTDGLNVTMSAGGLSAKRTSELGDIFLEFISSPDS